MDKSLNNKKIYDILLEIMIRIRISEQTFSAKYTYKKFYIFLIEYVKKDGKLEIIWYV